MNLLNESSLDDLYWSAVKAFPKTTKRQYAIDPIVIENIRWTPYVGLKTLFVRAEAKNEDRIYLPMILFKNVNYDGKDFKVKSTIGLQYQISKLSYEETHVSLRCNCNDFRYRFSYYDHLDKSLYGRKPAKYESQGGAPANPSNLPGMCKHLIKTSHILIEMGALDY